MNAWRRCTGRTIRTVRRSPKEAAAQIYQHYKAGRAEAAMALFEELPPDFQQQPFLRNSVLGALPMLVTWKALCNGSTRTRRQVPTLA